MYVNGTTGVRGRGPSPPPPTTCATPEGGTHGGGSFNITSTYISLPQAIYNLHSTLHCIALTQTKRLRKEIKYILIHNNTLQSFVLWVWSSIAIYIHVSHFQNWIILFFVSLQKWLAHFLLKKRRRNEGFKGTSINYPT